jgi:UDP-glucose 4-epimerase
MGILVTGGAGYIGSHVALMLSENNEEVIVLDNLSTGFRSSVISATFVQGNVSDSLLLERLILEHKIDTVMHFAAHTIVPESVSNPLKYYQNNTCGTRTLLEACFKTGIKQIIFSSTAAVYGFPESGIASEDTPTNPINPYGRSKLMSEWMLKDLAQTSDLRFVILRYFNVAGSDPQNRIGLLNQKATLLVKVACEAVVGKRQKVSIFGTDYPTVDGTGVRDYIHVSDLSSAHVSALNYLRDGGSSQIFNVGYGKGYSVLEVLNSVQREAGCELNICKEPRRAGDPPLVIAQSERIRTVLGWFPQYDNLDFIVRTALQWERKILAEEIGG